MRPSSVARRATVLLSMLCAFVVTTLGVSLFLFAIPIAHFSTAKEASFARSQPLLLFAFTCIPAALLLKGLFDARPPRFVPPDGDFAAAGVGVGFVFASNSSADDRDRLKADPASSQCPSSAQICADLKDAAETRASRANVAKVLLGAGGAAIIGGVVVLLVNPGKRSATATAITPMISPSLAGLSAAGRF